MPASSLSTDRHSSHEIAVQPQPTSFCTASDCGHSIQEVAVQPQLSL